MKKHTMLTLAVVALIIMTSMLLVISLNAPERAPVSQDQATDRQGSFIIDHDESMVRSVNVTTGTTEYSSEDGGRVIEQTFQALPRGGKVVIKEGDYVLNGPVRIPSNTELRGDGPGTRFEGRSSITFLVEQAHNVTLSNFFLIGSGGVMIEGNGAPARDIMVSDVTATIDNTAEGVFYALAVGTTVSNVSFVRCTALDCGTSGFMNNGRMDGGRVENVSYIDCKAIGCGLSDRYNDWVVGFDLAERVDVKDLRVVGCEASNNWQSGFHLEMVPSQLNVILENCRADNNGQAKGEPRGEGFGWGFVLYDYEEKHDVLLIDCTASGNWRGDTNLGPLSSVQI